MISFIVSRKESDMTFEEWWPTVGQTIGKVAAELAWNESRKELAELRKDAERFTDILHSRCIHPDYEYALTEGQRKAFDCEHTPDGDGWERNGWERFDCRWIRCWRRLKTLTPNDGA